MVLRIFMRMRLDFVFERMMMSWLVVQGMLTVSIIVIIMLFLHEGIFVDVITAGIIRKGGM